VIDHAAEWMRAWRSADEALQRVRREELRALDGHRALALLTGPADYRCAPRKARESSGLVEQQRWFMKARRNA
jgi:hypothetical protein